MTFAFLVLFSWAMLKAKGQRQVIALALAGSVGAMIIAPPRAHAQSLWAEIQVVLNVINGVIHSSLSSINTARTTISNSYQNDTWPVSLIDQARTQVTQMTAQYGNQMHVIFSANPASATLPATQQLESIMRNHQTNDFSALTSHFKRAYGSIPTTTAASPADRVMTDMDDALTLDVLKTLKESDAAGDLTMRAADKLENAASEAAPGSAPFITASAVVASIQTQAVTQKMLAAELREEAARVAHDNALRKRGATYTSDFGNQIINLLKHK
jgi:hypothetical protein